MQTAPPVCPAKRCTPASGPCSKPPVHLISAMVRRRRESCVVQTLRQRFGRRTRRPIISERHRDALRGRASLHCSVELAIVRRRRLLRRIRPVECVPIGVRAHRPSIAGMRRRCHALARHAAVENRAIQLPIRRSVLRPRQRAAVPAQCLVPARRPAAPPTRPHSAAAHDPRGAAAYRVRRRRGLRSLPG